MSGKDVLAVLAMTVPSFLLIALIGITLLPPANIVAVPPGTGFERNNANKDAHAQTATKKGRLVGDAPAQAKRGIATQDMIRDFWGRPYCASCVQVSETARCNSSAHGDERACF